MAGREAELRKYLEKKKKQKTRDRLMEEIAALSRGGGSHALIKTKKKGPKKKHISESCLAKDNESQVPGNEAQVIMGKRQEHDDAQDAVKQNDIACQSTEHDASMDFRDCQSVQVSENRNTLKDEIIGLQEHFRVWRCEKRLDVVQEQRRRLEIFYDEEEIVSCIKYNLVTFVQCETGCGKTTQIPQFLLENGFASSGVIGMTQPRRFSAVSISSRLNAEMNESLSGFKIKYENNITGRTKIKVMTEGILLKEIQSDFLLEEYSVVILDEVHERSSSMDVLVGLLSKIVMIRFQRRKPLRLVLMSATASADKLKSVLGDFAILKLNGKMFRVDVFYEEKTVEEYLDASYSKVLGILESEKHKASKKCRGKMAEVPSGVENDSRASILVFLPSKDDIYSLKSRLDMLHRNIVVLPLHSGLSKNEQNKVYETYALRKIVLATNIAETSVTIDDIVFVVDSGRVKHRIMDHTTVLYKVDLISKSSAKQRMGRAGRIKAGVCYRMYSGDTYENMSPENTPQILVEPLDSILLQLKSMGVQNILSFPFIDTPSEEAVKESLGSLQGIGAIGSDGNITRLGRRMCQYPVPPRYARLLLMESDDNTFYKLAVIVSILVSSFDLRRTENTEKYFISEKSDLVVALKIVLDYLKSPAKRKFSNNVGIPLDCFEEVRKMSSYLMGLSGKPVPTMELGDIESEKLCKVIYCGFSDQVAMNCGTSYLYKNGDVFVSRDSIDPSGQSIVFDHIVCGRRKSYAKGITVILPEWFR